jgi:hypothetical protein
VEGGHPTAIDVHQVLLTYKYLSDGWQSGMMEVAQAAANTFGAAKNIPDTHVDFGPVLRVGGYDMATSMTADPLTLRGAAGSDATRGRVAGLSNAVEGHLLNAYLHGPATSKNLAPFSTSMNHVHNTVVEEPLKKMVYNERRVFRYAVTVEHSTDQTNPLPRSIRCQVTELRADGSTVKPRGFVQDVKIAQDGGVTTYSRGGMPPAGGQLAFDAGGDAADSDIATVWNSLLKPWSHAYGTLVAKVLETAYDAVRAYEASQGRSFGLPETELESQEGAFRNARGRDVAMAVKMTAFPLTMRPPSHGSPGYQPQGLAWGDGLVRGHLLNHHLHGPADESNLAPMTNNLNQEFENLVENPAKRMVLTEGKVLYFHIKMEGETDHGSYEGIPETLHAVVHECQLKRNATDRQLARNWRKGPQLIDKLLYNVKPDDRDFRDDDFSESEDSDFGDDDHDYGKRGAGRQSSRSTDRKRGLKRRAPEPKKKATPPRPAKKQKG